MSRELEEKELRMKKETDLNKACVTDFINQVWNQRSFENLSNLITDSFVDHSQPYTCVKNVEGLVLYITHLEKYMNHYSIIREITCLGELVIARITMQTSLLDGSEKEHKLETFDLLRTFRVINAQIAEHWEIILDFHKDW